MDSVNALTSGLIDYAGLFPPAGLDMREAVGNYAEYLNGPDSSSLGSFIVPAERLVEFKEAAQPHLRAASLPKIWFLSVLAKEGISGTLDELDEMGISSRAPSAERLQLRAVETRYGAGWLPVRNDVDFGKKAFYVEIGVGEDVETLVGELARAGVHAKMRTGGVTEATIPSTYHVIRFMRVCSNAGVAFKATAGLHHPVRAKFPLTYEPASPRATMFGFINVFLAAAFMHNGADDATAARILEEQDPAAFTFSAGRIAWGDLELSTHRIAAARKSFAHSFGSCSFREPVDELKLLLSASRGP